MKLHHIKRQSDYYRILRETCLIIVVVSFCVTYGAILAIGVAGL